MRLLTFERPHRLAKLADELVAGVPGLRPVGEGLGRVARFTASGDGVTLRLEVPDDADDAAINAVVAAHDPSTPGPSELLQQQTESNETTLRDRADQAVGTLQNAWDNWASLTNAQKDAALKLNVRVTIALARLQLRKLDAS